MSLSRSSRLSLFFDVANSKKDDGHKDGGKNASSQREGMVLVPGHLRHRGKEETTHTPEEEGKI